MAGSGCWTCSWRYDSEDGCRYVRTLFIIINPGLTLLQEMGVKSIRELTDASIDRDMLNYMEKLIKGVEGVVEARGVR